MRNYIQCGLMDARPGVENTGGMSVMGETSDWTKCEICGCRYRPTTQMGKALWGGRICPGENPQNEKLFDEWGKSGPLWFERWQKHHPNEIALNR